MSDKDRIATEAFFARHREPQADPQRLLPMFATGFGIGCAIGAAYLGIICAILEVTA